jgi:hypothetical protein
LVQVQNLITPGLYLFVPQLGVASPFGVDPNIEQLKDRLLLIILHNLLGDQNSTGGSQPVMKDWKYWFFWWTAYTVPYQPFPVQCTTIKRQVIAYNSSQSARRSELNRRFTALYEGLEILVLLMDCIYRSLPALPSLIYNN